MERPAKSSQESDSLVNLLKTYKSFADLPDDVDIQFTPKPIVYNPGRVTLSEADKEFQRVERALRKKYPCSDALPESFDPQKLEASRLSRLHRLPVTTSQPQTSHCIPSTRITSQSAAATTSEDGDRTPRARRSLRRPPSNDSLPSISGLSVASSLDNDETLAGYESEVTIIEAKTTNITKLSAPSTPSPPASRPRSHTVVEPRDAARGRRLSAASRQTEGPAAREGMRRSASPPRIRSGSRPPLSKSSYVAGDGTKERVPRYFPFKSRMNRK
ncbi:hypothetical protein F5Y15DRAFT_415568 [Xylariaceae sp. FL0016]|nr:hypothetical protein F5Y15DRAFT_415568 [Xylariaceae sp. FL0016]